MGKLRCNFWYLICIFTSLHACASEVIDEDVMNFPLSFNDDINKDKSIRYDIQIETTITSITSSTRKLRKRKGGVENALSTLDHIPMITNNDRSRTGPYLWEKDNWEGSVINTCNLMKELTGSKSQIPVMDKVIENCPLDKCLSYGTFKDLPILGEVINETLLIFNQMNKIKNMKSQCYRINGKLKTKKYELDDDTTLCEIRGGKRSACCEGEFRGANSKRTQRLQTQAEPRFNCVGCMPHFFSIGPEKTGSTDLYNRISLLNGIIPAHRKETGWWTENVFRGPKHITIAGYMMRFFPVLSEMADKYDRESKGKMWKGKQFIEESNSGSHMTGRRRMMKQISPNGYITGEATPAMFNFQHHGLSLIPRWLRCIYPQAKIIVTMRNPIDRTYSDFHFFGKLQATKGFDSKSEGYVQRLNPEGFHNAMRAEVNELRFCFRKDDDGGLLFQNGHGCNYIRVDQLEKLGFQGKRIPGRLLMSLYPMHMALWLRYFPCNQILLLRSEGAWSEQTMHEIALFLDVDPGSAKKAAAAEAVRPEQFQFNKEANALGQQRQDMWNSTRSLLAEFFENHWLARFPEVTEQEERETCRD